MLFDNLPYRVPPLRRDLRFLRGRHPSVWCDSRKFKQKNHFCYYRENGQTVTPPPPCPLQAWD
jgi:hypothetical protein